MSPKAKEITMSKAITNPAVKKIRDENNKTKTDQYYEDIKTILASPSGVRFFKKFFEEGYMFRTSFTGNSQTFFIEGHRNFCLKFFNDICHASPESIPSLIIRDPNFDDNTNVED